jgi:hypothetical protein
MNSQAGRAHPIFGFLAVCLGFSVVSGCHCHQEPGPDTGNAQVLATCTGDCGAVARVGLTVKPGDGSDFPPITTDLAPSGSQWTGRVTGIPVGPGRLFQARAYDAQGSVTASGEAKSDINKNATAVVSISLNPITGPNHPPVLDGISASSNPVAPGGQSTVSVTAHDPDGDLLDYSWTANCGRFANPSVATTVWTAPQSEGVCNLSVTVSDGRGGSVIGALTLTVSSTGSATVGTDFNQPPVILGLSASIVVGASTTGQLTVSATDPDGDSLSYAWSSTCAGLSFDFSAPNDQTHPGFSLPGPSPTCAITVVVTDPPSRGGQTTGTLFLPPNQPIGNCSGVTCPVSDRCHLPGSCDPRSGTCGPQTPKTCPAGQACDPADGSCKPSGLCSGVVCHPVDLCHDPGTCDPTTGVCSTGAPKVCQPVDLCHDSGTCDLATGQCSTGAPKVCQPADLCHDPGTCDLGTGQCSTGAPKQCPPGESCDPADGQCKTTTVVLVVRPQVAKNLPLANLTGVGLDLAGATYVTGALFPPSKVFDGISLSSAGSGDVFLAKYDATGAIVWAKNFGDASDQEPADVALTDPTSNQVVVNGRFSGLLGSLNAGAAVWDFLLFLDAGTGALSTARAIDTGLSGSFFAVGNNPNRSVVAVCGKANKLAMEATGAPRVWATVSGANSYGGLTDIVLGLYSADGTLLWAKQIGTAADEECDAVTVDDSGNVIAAGKYSGSGNLTLAGATPLPNPGSSFRKHIWVAKFDGTNGNGLIQRSFGGGAGAHQPYGIALDASGNVFLAGSFSNTLPFDGTHSGPSACNAGAAGCLTSDGAADGFVAKLDGSFNPLWVTRIGVSTADDVIKGVAVDSSGNVTVGGFLNGSATWSNLTPITSQTAPATSPSITAPGGSASSFIVKLPGTTGVFNPATAATTGNANVSNANRVAINARGSGAVQDLVSFGGEYGNGTLDFGPPTTPISNGSGGAATFLVFAKLLP